MYMGSVGDLKVKLIDVDTLTYQFTVKACDLPDAQGYYQWDQLFIAGILNPNPPHFSGILYTDGSYGQNEVSYTDLSKYSQLKWEVRSLQGDVTLLFLVGGVKWTWDYKTGVKIPAPFPDTIPVDKSGNAPIIAIKTIKGDGTWQPVATTLAGKDLSRLHGAFGWELNYGANNVEPTDPSKCSNNSPTFVFEIRNVRYEK